MQPSYLLHEAAEILSCSVADLTLAHKRGLITIIEYPACKRLMFRYVITRASLEEFSSMLGFPMKEELR